MTKPYRVPRHHWAYVLIGSGLAALVFGVWAYLALAGESAVRAASGLVDAHEQLSTLLALNRLILTVVTVSTALIAYGAFLMLVHEARFKRAAAELLRQVRRFEEGDWHDDVELRTGDELETLGDELNALAKKHGNGIEGGDAEEIKSRFLEIISHQLRTPLTAVRWNLESLLKGDLGVLKRGQADLLRVTEKNYHGVLAMLSDWVEALEVERGLMRLNFAPLDLSELIRSMEPDFRQRASLKDQKLSISVAKSLPPIRADRLKLRFVINKLMSNAMDYTPEGGKVALKALKEDDEVLVSVKDSGIGIPDGDQREIFKKFFRAGNASMMQPNASGVGLFVARTLVEGHGGKISFASVEGKGTTFTFTVPVFKDAAPAAKPRVRRKKAS